MDIRAKVEARKAELKVQQQLLEAEDRARSARVRQAARAEAEKRVAVLGTGEAEQLSVQHNVVLEDALSDGDIEHAVEAALDEKAQDMWTNTERVKLLVFFMCSLSSFFIAGWLVGITALVLCFIYYRTTHGRHKRQLRAELDARERASGYEL